MNKHRLYGKSKKIHGRGLMNDLGQKLVNEVKSEAIQLVKNKLDAILSKDIKRGRGLKIFK